MNDLDSMFEELAQNQREDAARADADEALQARIAAKREAEFQREIRQGLRDANGDWIMTDEPENDEDDEDEDGDQ